MYDVITVGSSTIDVFACVESELIKIKTAHHEEELIAYPCGSKILINELNFLTGGGGTNTAVSLSRLGLNVGYLGKIGSGSNSRLIIKRLKDEKVDFVGVNSKKYHAGYSIILDSIEGDRTILAFKGANNFLDYKELNFKKIKTKWFYFSSMVGNSYITLEKLSKYAKDHNIKIAFNPSNYLAEKGYHYLQEILNNTELLILNKEESMLLAGRGNIDKIILKLMTYGPKQVVLTDGKHGAYTIHGKKLYKVIPNKIKVVETTGAGDAFASTFLAGIIKNKNIKECLTMASVNAESVVQTRGAKNGLLTKRKLTNSINKSKPQFEIRNI
jgi:ribokinase